MHKHLQRLDRVWIEFPHRVSRADSILHESVHVSERECERARWA